MAFIICIIVFCSNSFSSSAVFTLSLQPLTGSLPSFCHRYPLPLLPSQDLPLPSHDPLSSFSLLNTHSHTKYVYIYINMHKYISMFMYLYLYICVNTVYMYTHICTHAIHLHSHICAHVQERDFCLSNVDDYSIVNANSLLFINSIKCVAYIIMQYCLLLINRYSFF